MSFIKVTFHCKVQLQSGQGERVLSHEPLAFGCYEDSGVSHRLLNHIILKLIAASSDLKFHEVIHKNQKDQMTRKTPDDNNVSL